MRIGAGLTVAQQDLTAHPGRGGAIQGIARTFLTGPLCRIWFDVLDVRVTFDPAHLLGVHLDEAIARPDSGRLAGGAPVVHDGVR
jgi:hypothetical protein